MNKPTVKIECPGVAEEVNENKTKTLGNSTIKVINQSDTFAGVFALIVIVVPWLAGLAIAKGFWQTFCAIFPPYAWYLVVEKVMKAYGVL